MAIKTFWHKDIKYEVTLYQNSTETKIILHTSATQKTFILDHIYHDTASNIVYFFVNKKPIKIKIFYSNKDTTDSKADVYIYNKNKYFSVNLKNKTIPPSIAPAAVTTFQENLKSPLTGRVISINVQEGEKIVKNQPLLIIESMKMENEIRAASDAIIKTIPITTTDVVQSGQVIMTFVLIGEETDAVTKSSHRKKKNLE